MACKHLIHSVQFLTASHLAQYNTEHRVRALLQMAEGRRGPASRSGAIHHCRQEVMSVWTEAVQLEGHHHLNQRWQTGTWALTGWGEGDPKENSQFLLSGPGRLWCHLASWKKQGSNAGEGKVFNPGLWSWRCLGLKFMRLFPPGDIQVIGVQEAVEYRIRLYPQAR